MKNIILRNIFIGFTIFSWLITYCEFMSLRDQVKINQYNEISIRILERFKDEYIESKK